MATFLWLMVFCALAVTTRPDDSPVIRQRNDALEELPLEITERDYFDPAAADLATDDRDEERARRDYFGVGGILAAGTYSDPLQQNYGSQGWDYGSQASPTSSYSRRRNRRRNQRRRNRREGRRNREGGRQQERRRREAGAR